MRTMIAVAMFSACISSAAYASKTTYKLMDLCKFDIEQYCKNYTTKQKKKIKECLAQNEKSLLNRCQDHYKEAK